MTYRSCSKCGGRIDPNTTALNNCSICNFEDLSGYFISYKAFQALHEENERLKELVDMIECSKNSEYILNLIMEYKDSL